MKLLTPTDGPYWLKRFSDSILAAFKQVMDAPFRLWASDADQLPSPTDYEGGLAWAKDHKRVAYSDGADWKELQPWDPTLGALAAFNTNGLVAQTDADIFAGRVIVGPAAGISIANGDGVGGNPTIALANDLAALEALSGTGLARRTGADAWGLGGTVTVVEGGTGLASTGQGDILYADAANSLARLPKSTTASRYLSNGGTGNNPSWAQVDLVAGVSGILDAANGGTGSGFTAFTGPAASTKTFTLPNASDSISCLGQAQTFTAQQDFAGGIRERGSIAARFENSAAAGAPSAATGQGLEIIGASLGNSIVQSYNRTTLAYTPLALDGSTVSIRPGGTASATFSPTLLALTTNLSLGTSAAIATGTPMTVDLGGTFSSSAGTNLKLKLYNDGTSLYGLGVSANQLDYACPSSAAHAFHFSGFKGAQLTQISGRAGSSLSLNGQSPALNFADTGMGACFICTDLNKAGTALLGGYMVLGVPSGKGISLAIGTTSVVDVTGSGVAINSPLTLSTPLAAAQGGTGDAGTAWASFSPTWTNLTVGNGTVVARYKQIGKLVWVRVRIVFGSTTAVTGAGFAVSRPVNMASYGGAVATPQGHARFWDTSASLAVEGIVSWVPGNVTNIVPVALGVSGTQITSVGTSATSPFVWAAGDELMLQYFYEAA